MTQKYGLIALLLVFCTSYAVASTEQRTERIRQLYDQYQQGSGVPDITPEAVLALESGYVLVDVRTERERAVSMLPGAVDQAAYERMPLYRQQGAVIYCTIGVRSGKYVQALAAQGIVAKNLAGGLLAWVHAGGALFAQGQRVTEAHVYGRRWDLLPRLYQATWFWWSL